jgi:hypothetical protein
MKKKSTLIIALLSLFYVNVMNAENPTISAKGFNVFSSNTCEISKTHAGGCWETEVSSVTPNNGKFDIEILVTYIGQGGGKNGCKELSHYSIDAANNSFSNLSWSRVTGNAQGNMVSGTGNNDPFNKRGFKLDNVSNIGDGDAGSFKINYTLDYLQNQQFLAKAGNDYTQLASFSIADFQQVMNCQTTCDVADNTTSSTTITESQIKTLTGSPNGGTFSIVSGGGTISGNTYTPADVNANTTVIIRYTIAADGSCAATSSDATFTVTDEACSQSPTGAALGFNIFTLENLNLTTNETEGNVATGGDLTISGNYQIATNDPGSFSVNNVPIGLVVGGKVNYQSGNSLQINQNTYVKIGNAQNSKVWYTDQNGAN